MINGKSVSRVSQIMRQKKRHSLKAKQQSIESKALSESASLRSNSLRSRKASPPGTKPKLARSNILIKPRCKVRARVKEPLIDECHERKEVSPLISGISECQLFERSSPLASTYERAAQVWLSLVDQLERESTRKYSNLRQIIRQMSTKQNFGFDDGIFEQLLLSPSQVGSVSGKLGDQIGNKVIFELDRLSHKQ